jgi:leucyl aminopeptidase
MRRSLVVVAALAAGCGSPEPAHHDVYLSIGADALATARAVDARDRVEMRVLEERGDVAVIAYDPAELDALSHAMHEAHGRCGGFMAFDTLAEARQSLVRPADGPDVDYSLTRPEVVRAVLPAVDANQILGTIRALSGMKNRYYRSASGAAASTWLRDKWRSYSDRKDVTIELVDHGYAQKSVILTIPGTTRADEVIVLGGHLDSIALGGGAARAPGADDDASGIATLTEVARVLLARDVRPARTIKLMAYAAEEVGLRGSLSIARDFQRRKVKVVGALQLDMTNVQGSAKDIWLITDFTNAAQNRFLGRLIDAYVGATWGTDVCGYACSDHASWDRIGVPASMPFESRAKDMNKKIHTANDTLELSKNNADHAAKFARLATAYAIELGQGQLGMAGWLDRR